jgi:hypothetical protein
MIESMNILRKKDIYPRNLLLPAIIVLVPWPNQMAFALVAALLYSSTVCQLRFVKSSHRTVTSTSNGPVISGKSGVDETGSPGVVRVYIQKRISKKW